MLKTYLSPLLFALLVSSVTHAQTLILENGSYFDGKAFKPFKEIVVSGSTITSISKAKSNAAGRHINVNGKYVIPGLIDAHVHLGGCPAPGYVEVEPRLNTQSSLRCGVTTNVDLFLPLSETKPLKDSVEARPQVYSSVLQAGPILTAPEGHGTEYNVPTLTIANLAQAESVAEVVAKDAVLDVVKIVYEGHSSDHTMTKAEVKKIVEVSHKYNKKVMAHINVSAEAMDCIDAGVDALAHIPNDLMSEAQLQKLKLSGIPVVPTITVYQSLYEGHLPPYMSHPLLWNSAHPDYMTNLDKDTLLNMTRSKYMPRDAYRVNLRNCIRLGIPVLAGTDAGNFAVFYGYSLHNELLQYVKAGMTPAQALASATDQINVLLPEKKLGRVEAGYAADLVVLEKDPLKSIENTKSIALVIHKGLVTQREEFVKTALRQNRTVPFDATVLNIPTGNSLPDHIYTYNDSTLKGRSDISISLKKDEGGPFIEAKGNVVKRGLVCFAGFTFDLSGMRDDSAHVDISEFSAIEFEAKGNGETYYVKAISDLVTDYNYHYGTFDPLEWQTFRIPFSDFRQVAWFGKKQKLNLKTITMLRFEALGRDMPIEFGVRNVRFVK